MNIDTLLTNGHFFTGDTAHPQAHTLAIHQGRILARDDAALQFSATNHFDLGGAFACAGFNDVHAHSVWFGQTLLEIDLSDVTELEQVYQRIETKAAQLPEGEWVHAAGFAPISVGNAQLDARRLARAAQGRPVFVKHASGHAAHVCEVVLARIGRAEHPGEPVTGGKIVCDAQGRPTGLLEEQAMLLAQELFLPRDQKSLVQALDAATAHYVTEGLTSVTDAGIGGGWIGNSPLELAAYQRAKEQGVLRTRMQPMLSIDALLDVAGHVKDGQWRTLAGGLHTGFGDDALRLGPTKIFTDGSLFGKTAYMSEEYHQCPGEHGYLQEDPELLREHALAAAQAGWSLALHAIGDAAIDLALDIIEQAQHRRGKPQVPDRIEHGGVVRPEQVQRMASLDVVLVPQPGFISAFGDGMAERLGPDRIPWSYRGASLLEAGLTLPASSDRPVAPGAPLYVMQAFVQRLTAQQLSYGPGERLTAEQALLAYTRGSAAATGQSAVKGTLTPGKLGDVVVLGADPREVSPAEISQIPVERTFVGGQQVFHR